MPAFTACSKKSSRTVPNDTGFGGCRLTSSKAATIRREAWRRLFPPDAVAPLAALSPEAQADARRAAGLILAAHRGYLAEFNALTAEAKETFENRAWTQGTLNAGHRVQLYRDAVNGTWRKLQRLFPGQAPHREFWMGARQAFLEESFDDYETDMALNFFYSTMRLAFDAQDMPVEYADDGLAEQSHVRSPRPRDLQMLEPLFLRDREAYLVGKLRAAPRELPVVLALRHEEPGITVDAVLAGKEDMRNILFVSTRSTFHVRTGGYREVLGFLDTLAPERGHPAMCAVLGFTHPARVALNQRLRRHLQETGERFTPTPGRVGMAMVVFSPPSFPYVFKVIRDFSSKQAWMGRAHIMEIYRWVHEMNRGRLMLDAWLYRNLHFPRESFDEKVLRALVASAPSSVKVDGSTVVLKHVYAQRRVQPLSTFFDQTRDRASRERAIDALGTFIKDLAGMGFFMADCYGLPFNTGLTHGSSVALFDFDDLGPILRHRFRETPQLADEQDELLWNTETDGAWFSIEENDVLVDEWERFLGVPPDLQNYFREKHGDLFTVNYWDQVQRCITAGKLHFVLPYPPERRLVKDRADRP